MSWYENDGAHYSDVLLEKRCEDKERKEEEGGIFQSFIVRQILSGSR